MPARQNHGVNGIHKAYLAGIVLLHVIPTHLLKLGRCDAQVGQHGQVILIAEPKAPAKRGKQLLVLGAQPTAVADHPAQIRLVLFEQLRRRTLFPLPATTIITSSFSCSAGSILGRASRSGKIAFRKGLLTI